MAVMAMQTMLRPNRSIATVLPQPKPVPTRSDWAALYCELERLYVGERRKLRYIIQYVEREHGFKTTEQMYKQRFAKWGFHKNSKRSATTSPAPTETCTPGSFVHTKSSPTSERLDSILPSPRMSHDEGLILSFLSSVRTCNLAFFDSVHPTVGLDSLHQSLPPVDGSWLERSKELSFAFKLAIELYDQGDGNLAGRTFRKAFLLVEDLMNLLGPAMLWNLLEMMHHMVTLRHIQLFQMLLAHIVALINVRLPQNHPISVTIHALHRSVASLIGAPSITSNLSPDLSTSSSKASSSLPFLPMYGDKQIFAADSCLSPFVLSPLLERAWSLNADIVLERFDPRLYELYFCINWNSYSMNPPLSVFCATDQWFNYIEAQQRSGIIATARNSEALPKVTSVEEDKLNICLLAPRMDGSPSQDYEMLRKNSVAALLKHGTYILKQGAVRAETSLTTSRILAGIVTTKYLAGSSAAEDFQGQGSKVTTRIPRDQAENLACTIQTLIDLKLNCHDGGLLTLRETVEQIRSIVILREYARGETDPQVVHDLWQLRDALVAAGEHEAAQEVGQTALNRIEAYVQDVPVNYA